jgi:hypothetical protein
MATPLTRQQVFKAGGVADLASLFDHCPEWPQPKLQQLLSFFVKVCNLTVDGAVASPAEVTKVFREVSHQILMFSLYYMR